MTVNLVVQRAMNILAGMSQPETYEQSAERLLRAREAQGLVWSISARLAFYAVVILVVHLLPTRFESLVFFAVLCLVLGGPSIYSLVLARRQEH